MPGLVKVKILAQGGSLSMVEYNNKRWQVYTGNLTNQITQKTPEGFVTYAWISSVYLNKEWK